MPFVIGERIYTTTPASKLVRSWGCCWVCAGLHRFGVEGLQGASFFSGALEIGASAHRANSGHTQGSCHFWSSTGDCHSRLNLLVSREIPQQIPRILIVPAGTKG